MSKTLFQPQGGRQTYTNQEFFNLLLQLSTVTGTKCCGHMKNDEFNSKLREW